MADAQNNKVKYGLKNVYWSKVTETVDPETNLTASSYSTPEAWPGAVSIGQDPQGDNTVFRADNSDYFSVSRNSGFSGAFVSAMIPDAVREWCFGTRRDNNGVLIEDGKPNETHYIALMFQFEGDKKAIRHVLFKCSLSRVSITSETTPEGDTPNVQTVSTTITSVPRADADAYCHLEADPLTDAEVYADWFKAVYVPDETPTQYTVSITAAEDTTVTVTKGGDAVSDGDPIDVGDVLTISVTGGTLTVNGEAFVSGSTYTAAGNVVIVSTKSE